MLTGIGRRLQGMRWSVLICFWKDIFEPYMSPWVAWKLRLNFIHPCSAISPLVCPFALALLKAAIIILPEVVGAFSIYFFLASIAEPFSFFISSFLEYSSTLSSFLDSVFSLDGLCNYEHHLV